jgi:hypothetical protein
MFAAQDATALALADGHRFNSLTAFSRCSTVRERSPRTHEPVSSFAGDQPIIGGFGVGSSAMQVLENARASPEGTLLLVAMLLVVLLVIGAVGLGWVLWRDRGKRSSQTSDGKADCGPQTLATRAAVVST